MWNKTEFKSAVPNSASHGKVVWRRSPPTDSLITCRHLGWAAWQGPQKLTAAAPLYLTEEETEPREGRAWPNVTWGNRGELIPEPSHH